MNVVCMYVACMYVCGVYVCVWYVCMNVVCVCVCPHSWSQCDSVVFWFTLLCFFLY